MNMQNVHVNMCHGEELVMVLKRKDIHRLKL